MTHFSKGKWISYKDNLLPREDYIKMEDHLYTCDTCMDIFLSLIDSEELDLVETVVPSGFTENIMIKIEVVIPITKATNRVSNSYINKTKRKKKMIKDIFMYYVAVASVVLVLTAGGVFTKMAELPVENIKVDLQKTSKRIGKIYSLTEKITDSTNDFINNFGIKQQGGN